MALLDGAFDVPTWSDCRSLLDEGLSSSSSPLAASTQRAALQMRVLRVDLRRRRPLRAPMPSYPSLAPFRGLTRARCEPVVRRRCRLRSAPAADHARGDLSCARVHTAWPANTALTATTTQLRRVKPSLMPSMTVRTPSRQSRRETTLRWSDSRCPTPAVLHVETPPR